MKNFVSSFLLLALTALLPLDSYAAKRHNDAHNNKARKLIAWMKAHPQKAPSVKGTPLLNFSSSPTLPLQNQTLTWIVQFDNPFTNRLLSIDAKSNGVAVSGIQSPYKGMFVVPLGLQTEVGSKSLEVTLYAENAQNNADVRAAIAALDTDIRRLTNQINAERDPAKRAALQEQRDEKIALKNELIAQLKKFRYKLGTQTQAYVVNSNPDAPTLPRITSVSPAVGNVRGGTILTISGANFSSNVSGKIGGLASPSVTYVNETTVQAVVPDFETATGPKDVELRFTSGGSTYNAISPGAFYATVGNDVPSQEKPVAIASGSQKINLGASAQLDGSQSYTNRNTTLDYAWTVASAPVNSNYAVGQNIGSTSEVTVTPNAFGTYVLQLIVTEHDTAEHLVSEPSLVVVQAIGGPSPVASPINVIRTQSATTQVIANDPTPGESFTYAITAQPEHGSAEINSSGLVTYHAELSFAGDDELEVTVTNQSGREGSVVIPIHVIPLYSAPPTTGSPFYLVLSHGEPYNVLLLSSTFFSDPDGTIAEVEWDFGDGTHEKTNNTFLGAINHNYIHSGTYEATLTVTDNTGTSATQPLSVVVTETDIPTAKFTMDTFSGPAPLTVNFDASASSDSDGIIGYAWNWTNGIPADDEFTSSPTISHTFTEDGVYQVRLAAIDPHSAATIVYANVYVGVSPPNSAHPAIPDFQVDPARRVILGDAFAFDGTRSFNPNIGGTVDFYRWNFGDFFTCPTDGCFATGASPSHTPIHARNYFTQLEAAGSDEVYSSPIGQEVFVVNAGFAPRALPKADVLSGVAPLTVHFSHDSYDYDGTVDSVPWIIGDPSCTVNCDSDEDSSSYTYTQPGFYTTEMIATDNDGNETNNFVFISVTSSKAGLEAKVLKPRGSFSDPQREYRRHVLTGSCGQGNASSCYYLSKMYLEDGDTSFASQLKGKSCSMGYQPACAIK